MAAPEHDDSTIRFYYSFRSPYAWLAAEKLEAELGDLGVEFEHVPVYPKPELFPNDPAVCSPVGGFVLSPPSRPISSRTSRGWRARPA